MSVILDVQQLQWTRVYCPIAQQWPSLLAPSFRLSGFKFCDSGFVFLVNEHQGNKKLNRSKEILYVSFLDSIAQATACLVSWRHQITGSHIYLILSILVNFSLNILHGTCQRTRMIYCLHSEHKTFHKRQASHSSGNLNFAFVYCRQNVKIF